MNTNIRKRAVMGAATFATLAVLLTGCTNSGDDAAGSDDTASSSSSADEDSEQVVKDATEASGDGCTIDKYGVDKLDLKDAVVGFSQSEPDAAAFRAAETKSIQDEAKKVGVKKLIVTNANAELPKQISDIQDMLTQGVQVLIVAPVNSDGLDPALNAARDAGVPVLTIDRKLTNESCKDYVSFLGSDFYEQGKRAADAMNKATDGKANVAILLGASGNNVTDQRNAGFVDQVKAKYPDLKIVAQQTANFARDEGQSVTEQLLQSNPDINAIYAHNDEMGLGAETAIQSAGLKPGEDVKIVSIDGTKNAVQAIADGKYNAVIESNPRFGPLAFETLDKFYGGDAIPEDVIIEDREYDSSNAADGVAGAF
ncbi:ABC transporter substrate-binding protein [Cellulomonas sp. PhB143]|uniref:ABC transporter substrate-binding protein n=1 Tax=Cellulomonas sp. PhB143 TaxID=2485186 RepID=UPI001F24D8E8|nr:ABC transporter substrate-binding protein [Cellulomonas sp. PhB143]